MIGRRSSSMRREGDGAITALLFYAAWTVLAAFSVTAAKAEQGIQKNESAEAPSQVELGPGDKLLKTTGGKVLAFKIERCVSLTTKERAKNAIVQAWLEVSVRPNGRPEDYAATAIALLEILLTSTQNRM